MNLELLQRLVLTAGVSGREHRFRKVVLDEIQGLFDEVRVDPLGSIIAVRKPRPAKSTKSADRPTRVMLASHMDQIGFLVKHIDEKGFIRINPVGGFDTRNLFARFVTICPDVHDPSKDIPGVMNPGGRPIHIATEADKSRVPDISEFVIDTGLPAKDVHKKIRCGDMVVIKPIFERVGETIVGEALDNRFAVWLAIEAVRQLKHHDCEIYAVFTVQEEVGMRGAGAASHTIEPDIAVSLDVTLACDTPGVPDDQRVSKMGDGPALLVMDSSMISDIGLIEDFEAVAKKKKIKTQRSILPRGGNDGATIQLKNAGRRTVALVCPLRYVHTVAEMMLAREIEASRDLLAAWLESVK